MGVEPKTVLIVDDEADMLETVKMALEEDGYDFLTAADGEEAVAAARSHAPDLVILDVQMPRMNGFQAFAALHKDEATRAIPVIMLTGIAERTGIGFDAEDMGAYLGSEPEAYIDKPVDPEVLQATVRRVLGLS